MAVHIKHFGECLSSYCQMKICTHFEPEAGRTDICAHCRCESHCHHLIGISIGEKFLDLSHTKVQEKLYDWEIDAKTMRSTGTSTGNVNAPSADAVPQTISSNSSGLTEYYTHSALKTPRQATPGIVRNWLGRSSQNKEDVEHMFHSTYTGSGSGAGTEVESCRDKKKRPNSDI